MSRCLACANWRLKEAGREWARMGFGLCALGPKWQYLPPKGGCTNFAASAAEVVAARLAWLTRSQSSSIDKASLTSKQLPSVISPLFPHEP